MANLCHGGFISAKKITECCKQNTPMAYPDYEFYFNEKTQTFDVHKEGKYYGEIIEIQRIQHRALSVKIQVKNGNKYMEGATRILVFPESYITK